MSLVAVVINVGEIIANAGAGGSYPQNPKLDCEHLPQIRIGKKGLLKIKMRWENPIQCLKK